MAWVVIANLRGLPGDAASLAELANRPKSTVPNLTASDNIDTFHQKQHVGWHGFTPGSVGGTLPDGISAVTCQLQVTAPTEFAAVQRIHDRGTRTSFERSVVTPGSNTWSEWRAFAMVDGSMVVRGTIGTATVTGNLQNYKEAKYRGIWSFYSEYVGNRPKDFYGWGTLEVVIDTNGRVVHRATEHKSGRTWSESYDPTTATWTPWMDLSKHGALTSLRNAVAKSKTSHCNIVVVGDSNGEGVNVAAGITERWINKLQPALNRVAGNWEGAQFPFIPAQYGLSAATPGQPVVVTGDVSDGNGNYGFGWRVTTLRDTTASAVFTFTGVKAQVMYTKGPSGGLMEISVDGGAPIVIDTYAASASASEKWDTAELATGSHTVSVTVNSATPANRYVFLEGLQTWNTNDLTRGVRVIDASRSGRRMTDISTTRANYLCRAMTQIGNVELVIVNLATNDARAGMSLSDYRTAAEGLVSMMRTYSLNIPVVFVLPFVGADHTREQLNQYGVVLGNIASNIRGVHFVDLSLDMPQIPTDLNSPASQGLYSDQLHMTDQGHTQFAGHMLHALMEG